MTDFKEITDSGNGTVLQVSTVFLVTIIKNVKNLIIYQKVVT